jgi:hypothetical protein
MPVGEGGLSAVRAPRWCSLVRLRWRHTSPLQEGRGAHRSRQAIGNSGIDSLPVGMGPGSPGRALAAASSCDGGDRRPYRQPASRAGALAPRPVCGDHRRITSAYPCAMRWRWMDSEITELAPAGGGSCGSVAGNESDVGGTKQQVGAPSGACCRYPPAVAPSVMFPKVRPCLRAGFARDRRCRERVRKFAHPCPAADDRESQSIVSGGAVPRRPAAKS